MNAQAQAASVVLEKMNDCIEIPPSCLSMRMHPPAVSWCCGRLDDGRAGSSKEDMSLA